MKHDCKPLLAAINNYIEKADSDLAEALGLAGFIDSSGTVEEISKLEERIAQALKEQTDYFINSLESADDIEQFINDIWPELASNDEIKSKITDIFLNELSTYMPELANKYSAKIDQELIVTQFTKRTTFWISSWSADLGELMKLNSHTEIEAILKKGLQNGQSIAEVTQSILNSGIRDEYYKARRTALTEILRSHSYAHQEAIYQNPAAERKEWVHTGFHMNKPRENHLAMSGTIVRKDECFTLNGADGSTYYPKFPRDINLPAGESVNCHCIHRAIVSDDILGLPLEERQRLQA